jgi:hypothetical protein
MEFITILLLVIITALIVTPYIIKLVQLTKHKAENYDSDIGENQVKINALEDVYDLIIEDVSVIKEKHNTLTKRFEKIENIFYNAELLNEFVSEKITPKSTKDASFDNYCKTRKGTLEDKDMFYPKFKKNRREYEQTFIVKPTREDIELLMPTILTIGEGYSKKTQKKNIKKIRKSAEYKEEYNKCYAKIYAKRYYQYKKHIIN